MDYPTKINKHVSMAEAIKSRTAIANGISNLPELGQVDIMIFIAKMLFDPLRKHHNKPIKITSMFRSKDLNRLVGGSETSQHLFGAFSGKLEGAIDIDCDVFNNGITNAEAFRWIRDNIAFDQLIWEYGDNNQPDWVHVSYCEDGNRGEVLRSKRNRENKVYYVNYKGE